MSEQGNRRQSSATLVAFTGLLSIVTIALICVAVHGFFLNGWLLPYWNAMTDAQASIISQMIFFLAVSWGSLLVPLLFGHQLRSLQDAAAQAQETYDGIKRQMEESAADSRRQFASISRYHQKALGYFSGEAVFSDMDDDQKKEFVENAWQEVEAGLTEALAKLHGKTRQWVSAGGRYRSNPWWDRVKESEALGSSYSVYRTLSDAKWAASKGTVPSYDQLVAVNNALKTLHSAAAHADAHPTGGATNGDGSSPTPMQ